MSVIPITIDLTRPDEQIRKDIRRLLKTWWHDDDAELEVLSGGITNSLYKATNRRTEEKFLIRIFGKNTELFIDREKDNRTFEKLAEVGFGPKFIGNFQNGRVEGFVPSRPLEPHEMGEVSPIDFVKMISTRVGKLHMLDKDSTDEPVLWRFLKKVYDMAKDVSFDGSSSVEEELHKFRKFSELNMNVISEELEWMKTILPSPLNNNGQAILNGMAGLSSSSTDFETVASVTNIPTTLKIPAVDDSEQQLRILAASVIFQPVYAHNDLLAGNCLVNEDSSSIDEVMIIDYEYVERNYLGFDVANHFCEFAGFDFDLDKYYPKLDVQKHWYATWGEVVHASFPSDSKFYEELSLRTSHFALSSHFWWGIWAIVQARHSPIDFDFIDYAHRRFSAYERQKKELFNTEVKIITLK